MSRIGNKPVPIPSGVTVAVNGRVVSVDGPQGKLEIEHRPEVTVAINADDNTVSVTRSNDEHESRAFHGLTRSLINNMVIGVHEGYEKKLEIVGVGYVGSIQGDTLSLRVGFANEIKRKVPQGLDVSCPDQNHIIIKGCNKQQVGQFAAEVRAVRKPEPYKGKGIRYDGEYVKIKPGKSAV